VDLRAPRLWEHWDAEDSLVHLRGVSEPLLAHQSLRLLAPDLGQPLRRVGDRREALHDRRRLLALEGAPAALWALHFVGADTVERSPVGPDEPAVALARALPGEQLVAHDGMAEDGRTKVLKVGVLVQAIHLRAAGTDDDVGLGGQRRLELLELEHCAALGRQPPRGQNCEPILSSAL